MKKRNTIAIMKKTIVMTLAALLMCSICACSNGSTSPSSGGSSADAGAFSDAEIKSLVIMELYTAIPRKWDDADVGSCRMNINKTEDKNGYIYVYGSLTLVDKYGKLTGGYWDGSGTPYRTFTIEINKNTRRVSSCDLQ